MLSQFWNMSMRLSCFFHETCVAVCWANKGFVIRESILQQMSSATR